VTEESKAEPQQPLLRVITPDATPEEIAAVVAVFAAMGGEDTTAPEKPRSEWASPARRMRTPHTFGPGAWQASARGGR
jgi:hypothetical protein